MSLDEQSTKRMKWISVKEKRPSENEKVLWWTHDHTVEVGYWSEEENCAVSAPNNGDGYKWGVYFWMPLPECPFCGDLKFRNSGDDCWCKNSREA